MIRWPNDDAASLKAFYGDPDKRQPERFLVKVVPPFKMYYDGEQIKAIQFHKKAAPALLAALNEIWEHYDRNQAVIDRLGISSYAGSFNHRKVRGSKTKWSNHAYGAAIDLNALQNGLGAGKGTMPKPVIDAFKGQGALWGGDYKGRTDPMHFEFCSRITSLGFADFPMTDGDSDSAHSEDTDETSVVTVAADPDTASREIEESAERDVELRGSWLKRKWKAVTGWTAGFSGIGLGALYDPWVVVAIGGIVILIVVMFVLFMGPGEVRAWIRKQVS